MRFMAYIGSFLFCLSFFGKRWPTRSIEGFAGLTSRRLIRCSDDSILLFLFGLRLLFNKQLSTAKRIFFSVIHHTGPRRWCRRENLHLFGRDVELAADGALHPHHVIIAAAGISGDEIIGQILFFARLLRQMVKSLFKLGQTIERGLVHQFEDARFSVLGRHFELTGHMVLRQFL